MIVEWNDEKRGCGKCYRSEQDRTANSGIGRDMDEDKLDKHDDDRPKLEKDDEMNMRDGERAESNVGNSIIGPKLSNDVMG